MNASKEALAASKDMEPVQGTVDVDIPISLLWQCFAHANWWPRWNRCFFWVRNRDLVLGRQLVWCFQPIRWWYLYKMFAIAKIVEVGESSITWEVTALPGFYARHTYHMEDLGEGRTRFGSWEQAMGWGFRLMRRFWIAHFTFVKDRSLQDALNLPDLYRKEGKLTQEGLPTRRYLGFWATMAAILLLLVTISIGYRFYCSYVRLTEVKLGPGVTAVLGGGGNSLVIKDGNEVLLVDTKFSPASGWLSKRISREFGAVTKIVNTHYHYDHTEGNTNYPGAEIYAQRFVPELMKKHDSHWWNKHQPGIPTHLVDKTDELKVGKQKVELTFPGNAHTHGDLWVHLRRGNLEVISTGDLVFHTYYPFMDLGEGGIDIPGMIRTVRFLAERYPKAVFLPGHGSLAKASDLNRFADYLQFLYDSVASARKKGLTEDETVAAIDLSKWHLAVLPSFHAGKFCWSTAEMNIRWVYQIQSGIFIPSENCTF